VNTAIVALLQQEECCFYHNRYESEQFIFLYISIKTLNQPLRRQGYQENQMQKLVFGFKSKIKTL